MTLMTKGGKMILPMLKGRWEGCGDGLERGSDRRTCLVGVGLLFL